MSGSSGNTYPDASQSAPVAGWERRTIQFIRILRNQRLSPDGRGRRFTLSGYFTVDACRLVGEEDLISPGRHVRIHFRQHLAPGV
ncbi:hypothetical protein VitviT2T_018985 [Vitis vinifera]|uniref:Uncharacterized protein n=1 Tax=Vitis vinifera TaxID=29760 RepID=A0ABY9CZD9_VITVI|nr:hypothetical protein VitviT2T_018985 [Vitis vinifera]